ncbi:MAG: hypothetical protein ABW250_01385 [Pyrinomonadaceae bacterium]
MAVMLLLACEARAAGGAASNANTLNPGEAVKGKSPEGLENGLPPDPTERPGADPSKVLKPPTAPPGDAQLDDSTKEAYQNALRAYYEYQRSGLEHRRSVFAWQLLSSRIIFFTVIALVLSGVYFSGVQFHNSLPPRRAGQMKTRRKIKSETDPPLVHGTAAPAEKLVEEATVEFPTTQLEASLQGIKVSSPILGVIILALSFLFFYLYLKYVYPINEIF